MVDGVEKCLSTDLNLANKSALMGVDTGVVQKFYAAQYAV